MRINVERAAEILNSGGVVAVPTETVYGLGASLSHPEAIDQVFKLKGRPADNPLIIHISDSSDIQLFVKKNPPLFEKLTTKFWPGPLTIVLEIQTGKVPKRATAGLPTAAFRVPDHPFTRQLLRLTGPLVMPSANISGRPSATSPEHVENDFGEDFPVLDGGKCSKGLESTILLFNQGSWRVVRQGAIDLIALRGILGYLPPIMIHEKEALILCPGQKYRHYAPKTKLEGFMDPPSDYAGVIIGFADRDYPEDARIIVWGSTDHVEEVASNLYDVLRELDKEGVSEALVDMNFPNTGLWQTIRERLLRTQGTEKNH